MKYYSCKHILFHVFMILSHIVLSQNNNYEDVVYLKNGSIIRGVIIEQVPNSSIKIETRDRNVFFYKIDEIEKLTKEIPINNTQSSNKPNVVVEKEKTPFDVEKMKSKGFSTIIEIGNSFGRAYENIESPGVPNLFGFRLSLGAKLNPHLYLGGGFGLETETGNRQNTSIRRSLFFPIHSDIRVFILKKRTSPFIGQQIGYSFESTNVNLLKPNELTGLFFQTQVGVKANVNHNLSINFSIGYRAQQGRNNFRRIDSSIAVYDKKRFNHTPVISVGVSF